MRTVVADAGTDFGAAASRLVTVLEWSLWTVVSDLAAGVGVGVGAAACLLLEMLDFDLRTAVPCTVTAKIAVKANAERMAAGIVFCLVIRFLLLRVNC